MGAVFGLGQIVRFVWLVWLVWFGGVMLRTRAQ